MGINKSKQENCALIEVELFNVNTSLKSLSLGLYGRFLFYHICVINRCGFAFVIRNCNFFNAIYSNLF
jgi:hypothetical protein